MHQNAAAMLCYCTAGHTCLTGRWRWRWAHIGAELDDVFMMV